MPAQGLLSSSQTINFQPSHHTGLVDLRMLVLCCTPGKTNPLVASKGNIWGGGVDSWFASCCFPQPKHPRNGGRFPPTLNYYCLWLLVYIGVFRIPSLSLGKPVHSAAVQVWLFLYGAQGVSTQLEVNWSWPMKLEVPSMSKGHIPRDRNMLWIPRALEQKVAVLWILFWTCFSRLIHRGS